MTAVFTLVEIQPVELRGPPPLQECRERGCTAPGLVECAYADSVGRPCGTQWCSHHARRIGMLRYCRRHASTVTALGSKASNPRLLPPVDHRGASLVSWICTEGFPTLNQAVVSGVREGEVIFEDRAVNVVHPEGAGRRWERGWRIGDRTGITCKVMICVDEQNDALVSLKVNDTALAQGVPPWITRRRLGQRVPPEIDAADRRQFYSFLVGFIGRALAGRR